MSLINSIYAKLPKVSCILPAGYGDKYVFTAIDCFLNQNYEGELELVIVDNNDSSLELPKDERVRVVRSKRMSVGVLRNLGTSVATGEVCINWDEDDWSHPERVTEQVNRLVGSGKAVTGWHNILYWDGRQAFKYLYEPSGRNHPPYAMGTSQCFWKSWWERHKFEESGCEDLPFSDAAMHAKQLDSWDAGQLCVARAHRDSLCPPQLGHRQFPAVSEDALPKEFFDAIRCRK